MSSFEDFSSFLDTDFSTNCWEDDRLFRAIEMLQTVEADSWHQLSSCWKRRSERWQSRLAQTLDEAPPEFAVPILVDLLDAPSEEVALTATEALLTFAEQQRVPPLRQATRDRLRKIAAANDFHAPTINSVINLTNHA
jgi:hypothetical protein